MHVRPLVIIALQVPRHEGLLDRAWHMSHYALADLAMCSKKGLVQKSNDIIDVAILEKC